MKKSKLAAIGITVVFLLSGCRGNSAAGQNDELQQQISALQQQVDELQQELSAETDAKKTLEDILASSSPITEGAQDLATSDASIHHEDTHHTNSSQPSDTAQAQLDELSSMVDDFVNDADECLLSSTDKTIEQFFEYKQTAEQIDNLLEQYENWLEDQYNQKAMTRDEYKNYERALEKLEDKLDAAEDDLEYAFGIDD